MYIHVIIHVLLYSMLNHTCYVVHVQTHFPGAGSKELGVQLRSRVCLAQKKGELTKNACMGVWGGDSFIIYQDLHL